jgi:hypothetical protein
MVNDVNGNNGEANDQGEENQEKNASSNGKITLFINVFIFNILCTDIVISSASSVEESQQANHNKECVNQSPGMYSFCNHIMTKN